ISTGMAVPLMAAGRSIGAVYLARAEPRLFTTDECEALCSFAAQLAPIAEAMQLRRQLAHRRAEAEALADIAREGVRERDVDKLLALLARHTARLLGADYAICSQVDEREQVSHRGSSGERGSGPRRRPLSFGGISRVVLDQERTIVMTL